MKKVILFVHGLGGSDGTFGQFPALIAGDSDLDYATLSFVFPTSLSNIIALSQYARIQTLSDALKTFINHKLQEFDEVVLVAHSLGGLIVRQYLLTEWNARRDTKVKKIIFYAVPQDGAGLAKVSSFLSWRHPQLKQLTRASEFLENLNNAWASAKVDVQFDFKIVIAAGDGVVSENSSRANFRHHEIEVLADKNHRTIVKPTGPEDLAFTILKTFLLSSPKISHSPPTGALSFKEWAKRDGDSPFFPDAKRKNAILEFTTKGISGGSITRIIGLSGLGKTRLLLEAIKDMPQESQDSTIYVDVAIETNNLLSRITEWVSEGAEGTLVVDNCPVAVHDNIARTLSQADCKIGFVSIDSDLKKSGDCRLIELGRLDDEMIKAMLTQNYGQVLADIDRIVSFAQGFPQMAVLIANARINLDPNVGQLTDDLMAHRLLWGDETENPVDKRILLGCSLFDRFGLEEEAEIEYKFIASSVVNVGETEFYECVRRFALRGVIDRRGRYCQLVPKPLAIRLASLWWNLSAVKAQSDLLEKMPNSLVDSFCSQIEKLDFLPNVKTFTVKLCGHQGFFGQAEVILSIRGSRFFRAFVNVNPEATVDALYRIVTSLDRQQLTDNVSGEVRRNLVWALERLCFHENIFMEAGWILFLLARSENETWSNNATGMFSQLFRVQLSGTSAPPALRLDLLTKILSINEVDSDLVALSALEQMINLHGGTRTIGAEYQGSGPPLEEWRAEIWQEIFDYWDTAIDILLSMVDRGDRQRDMVLHIIGNAIRPLIGRGRITTVDRAIQTVIKKNGKYWPSALDSLKTTEEHDLDRVPQEAKDAIALWLKLLDPSESAIEEKLLILVIDPPWEHEDDEHGNFIDVAAKNATQFAKELLEDPTSIFPYIPKLLSGSPKQAYAFGLKLSESGDVELLIRKALYWIIRMETPNISFALGLLEGLNKINVELWSKYLFNISKSLRLRMYYPDFVRTGEIGEMQLDTIFELVSSKKIDVERVESLAYGSVTSNIPSELIESFCEKFSKLSPKAAWIALDILFMYARGDTAKYEICQDSLCRLTLLVSLGKEGGSRRFSLVAWSDLVKKFLDNRGEDYAIDVSRLIISSLPNGFDYQDMVGYLKPLLVKIFQKSGKKVWPIFSSAIASSSGMNRYWIHALFEKDYSFSNNNLSLFSLLDIADVIRWCTEEPQDFPRFVASCIDVYHGRELNPLALALLEKFGADPKVGGALAGSMATRSWSGSLIPHLEADRNALLPLLDSNNSNIRGWARLHVGHLEAQIVSEKISDDEQDFGIY